jgi:hypothetical protein
MSRNKKGSSLDFVLAGVYKRRGQVFGVVAWSFAGDWRGVQRRRSGSSAMRLFLCCLRERERRAEEVRMPRRDVDVWWCRKRCAILRDTRGQKKRN